MSVIDYYGPEGWGAFDAAGELDRQRVAREAIKRLVTAHPAGPLTILDAGCGDGGYLDRLAKHLDRPQTTYVGLDYSARLLEAAAELPYTFQQCDFGVGI